MINFNVEQTFLVVGASSGIGYATAQHLNQRGASVVGIGRNNERLAKLKETCNYPVNMHIEQKDITENIAESPNYIKSLKEIYGKFSGLVYCAGIGEVEPLQMISYEDTLKEFETNYFAPLFFAKGFADKRLTIGKGTSCVFVSSIASFSCDKGHSVYAGSKAALAASIKSIAKEVASKGIRMNCVSPSAVRTPMLSDASQSEEELKKYPFGLAEGGDISNMIVYLLSENSQFISAQNYIIDSGGVF